MQATWKTVRHASKCSPQDLEHRYKSFRPWFPSQETSFRSTLGTISIVTIQVRSNSYWRLHKIPFRISTDYNQCTVNCNSSSLHPFQHSYIPQEILPDLGRPFVSDLFHELTQLLKIRISHASLKHPQKIGVIERAHATLTRFLKLNSNQRFTNLNKCLNLASFIHNTSFDTSIGCTPTAVYHGRDPVTGGTMTEKQWRILIQNKP